MAVDVSRTQDVYKDAGQSVNFTTLLLNRKDRDVELEVIQDMADRIQTIKRSVSIRANGEGLGIAFGFLVVKHGTIYSLMHLYQKS